MLRRLAPYLVAFAATLITPLAAQITFSNSGFENQKVVSGFSTPMGFVWAPDGRIFVWERRGKVKIVKNGTVLSTPFLDISSHVNSATDRGLVGLALDPDFANNGYVYLSYVYENGGDVTSSAPRTERVTRVQADPNNPDRALSGETVILGKKATLPCNSGEDCMVDEIATHTIDHLAFGRDGKLYLSVGDGADYRSATTGSLRAQDVNSLNGKVLRFNKDGSAPTDNPFSDGTNSPRSKVYAYGVRNPYRFSFGPNDEVIIGDVGWTKFEEVDIGRGKNFGWPCYEGPNPQPSFQSKYTQCQNLSASSVTMPNYSYAHITDIGGCIIMGPYLANSPYPSQYDNQVYFADFTQKWIKRATVDSAGKISNVTTFATSLNSPNFLSKGPDGNLYWLSISAGAIYRITYTGTSNRPPIAVADGSPKSGLSPLQVSFTSAGSSDPDGDPLTYSWNFGDGQTSTSPNPIHTYSASGVVKFTATLTVKDTAGLAAQAGLTITLGSTPPKPTINAPSDNTTVDPNATVNFSGRATDAEDGDLPSSALLWSVILHHNTHTHLIKQVTGTSGSFVADLPDTIDAYWYELSLRATDSAGVAATKSVRINIRYTRGSLPCTLKTTDPSVTICTPADGSTVTSPVRISGGATNSAGVTGMKIYIDGVGGATSTSGVIDTTQTVAAGTHKLTMKSWDKLGRIIAESRNFTVGNSPSCTASSVDPSITVCSPLNNATVASPAHFVVLATNSAGVTGMKIYVDGVGVYTAPAGATKIDTNLPLPAGTHAVTIKTWDRAARVLSQKLTITVSP